MIKIFLASVLLLSILCFSACKNPKPAATESSSSSSAEYFSDTSKVKTGGVQIIPITTKKGKFNVWTKKIGNNPKIKLLLLTGGPGLSHEYMECMESFLPAEGIEFIYYDQLGTGHSDNPKDTAMWDLPRYVEEVEQVRQALKLDKENFYLLGHSWGGILAMEYALKYQKNLKGLIISNMMSSAPDYGNYAENVLAKQFDPAILARVRAIEAKKDYENPEYMQLLLPNFYAKHFCRIPLANWPEPINRGFSTINNSLYVTMQGPSEFGIAGKLTTWDRKADLKNIAVPTLSIGAKYDTMDPEHMRWMASQFQNGSFLYCANGSHASMYDDQQTYMHGIIKFMKGVDAGQKKMKM
jgi:proline iminopeptidase